MYIRRVVHIIVPYLGGRLAKIGVLLSKQDQTRHNHACRHEVCDMKKNVIIKDNKLSAIFFEFKFYST